MTIIYTTIITILMIILAVEYWYALTIFRFARRGEAYLQSLALSPERLGSDPQVKITLNTQSITSLSAFIIAKPEFIKTIYVALVFDVIGIFYLPEALVAGVTAWIFAGILAILNFDAFIVCLTLHNNKLAISKTCNIYYELEQKNNKIIK